MYVNRHKYFRWTPRTAGITFMYMVVVPAIVGYIGYTTDVSRDEWFDAWVVWRYWFHAGKVWYEGEAERRHHCGILDGSDCILIVGVVDGADTNAALYISKSIEMETAWAYKVTTCSWCFGKAFLWFRFRCPLLTDILKGHFSLKASLTVLGLYPDTRLWQLDLSPADLYAEFQPLLSLLHNSIIFDTRFGMLPCTIFKAHYWFLVHIYLAVILLNLKWLIRSSAYSCSRSIKRLISTIQWLSRA